MRTLRWTLGRTQWFAWFNYVLTWANFGLYVANGNLFSLIATMCFAALWLIGLLEADQKATWRN